jgi:hypothetical protein
MVQMARLQQACPQAIRLPVAERADAGRTVRCAGVPQADYATEETDASSRIGSLHRGQTGSNMSSISSAASSRD